jgi:hypothetical protein
MRPKQLWDNLVWGYRRRKLGIPPFVQKRRLTLSSIRKRHFALSMETDDGVIFTEAFFDDLTKERRALNQSYWKVALFYYTLVMVLGLSMAPFKLKFNVLGVSVEDLYALREVFLLLIAIVMTYLAILVGAIAQYDEMLETYVERKISDIAAQRFYALRFRDPLRALVGSWLAPPANHRGNLTTFLLLHVYDNCNRLVIFGFIALSIVIPCAGVISILKAPTHSLLISSVVVVFWVSAAMTNLIFVWFWRRGLVYKDFTYVTKLADLEKTDPALHHSIHQQILATKTLPPLD